MADDAALQFDFEVSPETLARLQSTISEAVGDAFKQGFSGRAWSTAMKAQFDAVAQATARAAAETKKATAADKEQLAVLSRLEDQAANYIKVLRLQGEAVGAIVASSNRVRTNERQQSITQREELSRRLQERLALIDRETKSIAQSARTQGELQVNAAKVAGKQRVQITRAVLETIGRLEKVTLQGFVGAARAATSAVSRSFGALANSLRRSDDAFTRGLPAELRTRESLIRGSFLRQETALKQSTVRQQAVIAEAQRRTSTGVAGAITGRGFGGGLGVLAGGAGIAGLLTAGFQRFSDLERINKQFLALTGNLDDTNLLLAQVKEFAKETPFDLVGVADLAKGFLAIKTPVDQVLPRVQAIADAVALTGGGVDELNRIQRALGQIVSTGKLQGDELNQLAENLPGLNIRQILADQLTGGNVQDLVRLQEAGELTADLVVNGLITGLANDPRLAGASKALAETLGGRTSNLKESFADFGAAIIGTIAGPLKVAITGTQVVLQGLADFIKGENLGPVLTIVRDGLKGVAFGLLAVLGAKAGIEALKLLALTARLLVSPFGAVLLTAGLLGGALSILLERSEPLRNTFRELGDRIGDIADRVGERLQPALDAASDVFDERVIPAINTAAQFLADNLLPAIDGVISFVLTVAIPALVGLADVVERGAGRALEYLSDQATRFFDIVRPLIRPAVDGFRDLGEAIGLAFGGDFSKVSSGAASALSGIGATVANIAGAVGTALLPVGQKVLNFFLELFSGPNLKKYASAFLGFVEEVGRIIGSIVSSPIFVKALAGIAAAAVIVAARFVEGFGRGVIANIPELAGLIGNALLSGLQAALSNPLVVLGAIALTPLISRLVRSFTGAGEAAGGGFLGGVKSSLSRSTLATVFGGANGAIESQIKGLYRAEAKELNQLASQTRILGGNLQLVKPGTIDAARAQVKRLSADITDSQLRVLRWRDAFTQGITTTRLGLGGLGTALRGVGGLLTAPLVAAGKSGLFNQFGSQGSQSFLSALSSGLRAGGSQIVGGVRTAFDSLKLFAQSQGISVGQAFGRALQKGAQVGLAAVGGFVVGEAEGERGGSGAFSALTAGLTGLVEGGPVVGAVAAGASLIGTAFGQAGAAAKKFRESVKVLTDALKQELNAAIESGAINVDRLRLGLLNFGDVAGLDSVLGTFEKELGDDGVALFAKLGLSFQDNILPIIQSGGDLDQMKAKLRSSFLDAAASSDEFATRFGADAAKVRKLVLGLQSGDGFGDLLSAAASDFIDAGGLPSHFDRSPFATLLRDNADFLADVANTAGDIERGAKITKATLDSINASAKAGFSGFDTTDPVGAIDTVEERLGEFSTVLSGITSQWANFLNPDAAGGDFGRLVNEGIVQAAGLGQQRVSAANDPIAGAAQSALISGQFGELLARTIEQGVKDGIVIDEASALAAVQPLIDAYVNSAPEGQRAVLKAFAEGQVPKLAVQFDNVVLAQAGIDAANQAQAVLDAAPPELKLTFNEAEALVNAGLTVQQVQDFITNNQRVDAVGLPLPPFTFDEAAALLVARSAASTFSDEYAGSSRGKMETAGTETVVGLINGIEGKTSEARAAARALARAVNSETRLILGISSPSKVFRDIGRFIGDGLVLGVQDSTNDVTAAITGAIDTALLAARAGGSKVADALREAGAGLFGALAGSGSPLNLGSALTGSQSGVTTAVQSFLSTFDSNLRTVFDVGGKKSSELTAADKNILGESLFSLNASDVIGASNLAALTGAFDAIAELGETMLGQGQDASAVTEEIRKQVDALIASAVKLGFSGDEVNALADALGLSNDALSDFVQQLNDITIGASDNEQNSLPTSAPQPPSPSGPGNRQGRLEGGSIVNHIYLPSGDPEANALAVANRQASLLFH